MRLRTVNDVIHQLPKPVLPQIKPPNYSGSIIDSRRRIALAVESMKYHMTDEGWQVFNGLEHRGYVLCGYNLPFNVTNTLAILQELNPAIVIVQDKREWDPHPGDFRDSRARFDNITALKEHNSFKVTVLKDAHQKPLYHLNSADEIGCHAWIINYHPTIVSHVAPYVRPQHLIRTYHTIDRLLVKPYTEYNRRGCVISGATSNVYPLRSSIINACMRRELTNVSYYRHPGYHRRGTETPSYLNMLSNFKISICTSSVYGYSLRKIIESTACGCIVLSDLPTDEFLPYIDNNIVRIPSDFSIDEVRSIVNYLTHSYDSERQEYYANLARKHYDYREVTSKLADDIETLRVAYNATLPSKE